jgi:hypothetical protein
MQTIDILLIDDNKDYCRSLRNRFLQIGEDIDLNIQVRDFQNLEDGFAELEKDSKYKALILDAKALITPEQETEDFNFLPLALHRLEKLNQKTGRIHTPFAVITGYYDNFLSFDTLIKEQKGKLFDKSSQEEEMLQYLLKEIENCKITKIEKQYADVFQVFDKGYLESKFRKELLQILQNIEDSSQNQNILRAVRVIQDEVYIELNRKNIVPSAIQKLNNRTNRNENFPLSFADKNKHLSGNEIWDNSVKKNIASTTIYQTSAISYLASAIYKISSDFGNHPPQKPTNVAVDYWEMPSNYAVKSLVFALLEQLLWFKNLMEKP